MFMSMEKSHNRIWKRGYISLMSAARGWGQSGVFLFSANCLVCIGTPVGVQGN